MNARHWALVTLLAVLWGSSFLMAEIALKALAPFTIVFFRIGTAAVLLCITLRVRGMWLGVIWQRRRKYIVLAFFGSAFPFAGFSWGQQYIDSSLAGVLNSTTPLFTLVMACMVGEETMRWRRLVGLFIGVVGITVLFQPGLETDDAFFWGSMAGLAASASYGVVAIFARRYTADFAPMENACGQLIWATLLLLPLCLWEAPWQMPLPPAGALLAVASMAMFSTYCAFLLYFYLIRTIGAVNTTQTAFIIPLVAVILGVMLLNENIGTAFFVGASLVMFGLLIANRRTEPGDDNCKK